jgi:YesN/AraC family two-component response regulator
MTIKIVNYLPRKIDEMRMGNENITEKMKEDVPLMDQKKGGLEEKVGVYLNRWVEEKRYCTAELSIKDVATQIGTNHSYLSHYLNDYLGMSFQTWLNTLRIEESKHILTTENISIENVGIKVGIPESYNFSRWFKVITGTTPLRFRREGGEKPATAC